VENHRSTDDVSWERDRRGGRNGLGATRGPHHVHPEQSRVTVGIPFSKTHYILYYYYCLLKYYNNGWSSSRMSIVVMFLSRIHPGNGVDGRRKHRRRKGRRHQCTAAMSGRRMCRDPVSCPRPRRLSVRPGSGRVRVLSSRLVRLGRNGSVQRCRPAVRRQLGVCQNGIPTIIYHNHHIILYIIILILSGEAKPFIKYTGNS